MASLAWRQRLRLNVYPYASRRNGSNNYLRACGYVKIRVDITMVRDTNHCIWGWVRISPLPLKNAQENTISEKSLFFALQYARAEKVDTTSVISEENCGMQFTKIVTNLARIYSALTHLSPSEPEGFTWCIPRKFIITSKIFLYMYG